MEIPYNHIDILYSLMSYVNVSSSQDMYYTIAHTVLTHLDRFPNITINELADMCYTSPATISRFCKDLNCKNFAYFKRELAVATELAKDEIHFPDNQVEQFQKNPNLIIDKLYTDAIESLLMAKENINIHEIEHICQMIYEAKDTYMFGFQFNKIVANDFQLKMLKLGKMIYSFVDRGDEMNRLNHLDEESLVIILSVSARKELVDEMIEKIKDFNSKIVLITMNKNYKNDNIDYIYRLEGLESDYTVSSLQGTLSFISLLNVIYIQYGLIYKK